MTGMLETQGISLPRLGQRANLDARSLTLDEEDRRVIASLPKRRRLVNPPFAPRWDRPMAE